MNIKKFTILHSNDMHGDFLSESLENHKELVGGLSLLSGYINKVRREEKNVLFVIAGDMLQGSLIDAEYKGASTFEIMNYLAPDVVALGNHEVDYGLPHLLFLERIANFPIVNANIYIKKYNKRLMNPYKVIKKDGFDILFTGILTEKVMDSLSKDSLIGSIVTLEEASNEIGKICNAYKSDDIDLTIILTHIGLESDKELASILKPEWGVDLIIGGHSHSIMSEPLKINNILIAQAGSGTNQIGRFDIEIDDDTNSIINYNWQLINITSETSEYDRQLEEYITTYKNKIDSKYNTILCKFSNELTHPSRTIETTLGNLFADALAEMAETDIMLVGSGCIRGERLGPIVTLKDYLTIFPYDDTLTRFRLDGNQIKRAFSRFMRAENRRGEGECYQVNSKIKAVFDSDKNMLISLKFNDQDIQDKDMFTLCIQGYHYANSKEYLDLTKEDLISYGKPKTISTSVQQVMEEYLRNNQNISRNLENRLCYLN